MYDSPITNNNLNNNITLITIIIVIITKMYNNIYLIMSKSVFKYMHVYFKIMKFPKKNFLILNIGYDSLIIFYQI